MCWWCSNDALMIDDALMMCSWCADNALMMCWWWPDDALIMHWWCTDDALSVKHRGQASDLHWRFYGGRINGLSEEQSFSHILVPCHLDWVKSAHSIARRTAGQAYQWAGLICLPPLPLPPVLQCQVGLRWMKHCKLCGIGLDLGAKKKYSTFIQGANYVPRPVSHLWEFVRTRGVILRQGAITKATDIPPSDMYIPWWLALRGSIIVSRGGQNNVKRSSIIWITSALPSYERVETMMWREEQFHNSAPLDSIYLCSLTQKSWVKEHNIFSHNMSNATPGTVKYSMIWIADSV